MAIPGGAGALNQPVTLQKPTRSQGSAGQPKTTYADFATVWASAQPLRGREFVEALAYSAELTQNFRIYYVEQLTSEWRIKLRTRTLRIVQVVNVDERNEYMEMMCVEDVSS